LRLAKQRTLADICHERFVATASFPSHFEMERAAIELGAKLRTVQQWRYREAFQMAIEAHEALRASDLD
jgi:hypothetical protein